MSHLTFKIVVIALIQTFSTVVSAHVKLDYPVGGETFTSGTTVNIQWHVTIAHNTLNWILYYSPDGGINWETIQSNIPPGQLSYLWQVPAGATTQGQIRVFQNNSSTDYQDMSMNFTIQPPVVLPEINIPAHDTTIESDVLHQGEVILTWLNHHGGATATNFCGTINWTNDFDGLSIDCGATGSSLVTFTATDQCGSTSASATLTVIDSANPIVDTQANDLIVECDGSGNTSQLNTWLQSHGGGHATDAGGSVAWTHNFTALSNGCGTSGNTSVIFTAADACGNSTSTTASFSIVDTTVPGLFSIAHDTTIDCAGSNTSAVLRWLNNHGGAAANDNCGNIHWTHNFPAISDTCAAAGNHIITFTASDECGNTKTVTATFTILGASGTSTPESSDAAIKLYPNPVHDVLNIDIDKNESQSVDLVLYDAFGKTLWFNHSNAKHVSVPVSKYSAGIYFIAVRTDAGTYMRKVVIE
ncbi:MAG: T9SS type A sorting domain-containing protein [Saprospiraceae bacterium]